MKRTKSNKIQTLGQISGSITGRAALASYLGIQYSGDRNLYQALGYKTTICFKDYEAKYKRLDIAKAIIDRPAKATWAGDIMAVDTSEVEDTTFEKAYLQLSKDLKLKSIYYRADRLSSIGEYGVIILGLDDIQSQEDYMEPVQGKRKLLYLKVANQGNACIEKYEEDPKNPRYGHPLIYKVTISNSDSGSSVDIQVHYSRIIHIVPDPVDSEIIGEPILKPVYNRLDDLEKLIGGDAEMFWRGARPGYSGKLDKDYQMTTETKEDLQNQIDEYENNLRRILINEGVDYTPLTQDISDPKNHVDIQIQMISAETGIPKRILTGSERGELSSQQDRDEWNVYVSNRREEYAENTIIRPFIDICIKYGILPKPEKDMYFIKWSDLFAPSDKEASEVGRIRATALKEYSSQPSSQMIIPPKAFFELFLGLKKEQIEMVEQIMEEEMMNEENDFNNEEQED